MDGSVSGRCCDAGNDRWSFPSRLRGGGMEENVVRSAGSHTRCSAPRTRTSSSEGFHSGVVAPLSSGFGFYLFRIGVFAKAVLFVPFVAAVALFGFVLLENVDLRGMLSVDAF